MIRDLVAANAQAVEFRIALRFEHLDLSRRACTRACALIPRSSAAMNRVQKPRCGASAEMLVVIFAIWKPHNLSDPFPP